MKNLIVLIFLFIAHSAMGATCTSISRSNYAANSVLTSTALNADMNTVYNNSNAYDGGCITDNTIEFQALNETDNAALVNAVTQGCKVTRSDANTLSVDKCFMTVNGTQVRTTTATTVTWGCGSCSAEVVSTTYYLYAKTGSSGSTLNLLISTVAPNNDGYDSSNNKVLAKFYNNLILEIHPVVQQWLGAFFDNNFNVYSARIANNGTATITTQGGETNPVTSVSRTAAGTVTVTFTPYFFSVIPNVSITSEVNTDVGMILNMATTSVEAKITDNTLGADTDSNFSIIINRQSTDVKSR